MPEYIEREALKEYIKNHFKKLIDEGYVYDEIFDSNAEFSRIIDEQPTADVTEVKHGKCIKHKLNQKAVEEYNKMKVGKKINGNSIYWTCSCCDSWGKPIQKYCPICGAKMDKE